MNLQDAWKLARQIDEAANRAADKVVPAASVRVAPFITPRCPLCGRYTNNHSVCPHAGSASFKSITKPTRKAGGSNAD